MYNIRDYGAVSDGITINSAAIQAAIDACAVNGGGRVVIPAGTFKSGTIWLKSNVELHLEMGAVLLGSDNIFDYNAEDAYPQNYGYAPEEWVGKHLIIAHEVENIAITGLGTIIGNGQSYFTGEIRHFGYYIWRDGVCTIRDKVNFRPGQMIAIIESKHIHIENVTLRDSTCWSCYLHGCEYVTIKGMKVFNDTAALNTDGIDLDCCRYVTVSDCIIETGDDAIAIRGVENRVNNKLPCEYITITNCVFGVSSSVFRISVGTGIIRHIRVSNISVYRGGVLVQFATSYQDRGGVDIEDVNFSNISATNIGRGLIMYANNGSYIKNITMENIRLEAGAMCNFSRTEDGVLENIHLRNIELRMKDLYEAPLSKEMLEQRGPHCLRLYGMSNSVLENVTVYNEFSECPEPVSITDCSNLEIKNCNF